MAIELATAAEHDPRRAQPITRCASDRDGDCSHHACPQLRDREPQASGRSCPLYDWNDDDAR